MAIIKSTPVEKVINGKVHMVSEVTIVSEENYRTKGESFVIIKSVNSSKIVLDHSTTNHVTVKSLTNVLIIPSIGKIDEEYDEVFTQKGACVEFIFASGNWYIMSSDGLKLP
jgi:hypothetical protein